MPLATARVFAPLICLLALMGQSTAAALEPVEIQHDVDSIALAKTEMNAAANNLIAVVGSLPQSDQAYVRGILAQYQILNGYMDGIQTVGMLIGNMHDSNDYRVSQKPFGLFLTRAAAVAGTSVNQSDTVIHTMRKSPFIGDSIKLRDAMAKCQKTIESILVQYLPNVPIQDQH
jgi:hypothetical protein